MAPAVGAEQARERTNAALDAIDAAHDVLRDASSNLLGNKFRVDAAERLETQNRTNRGLMYRFFGEIADPPDEPRAIAAMRSALWARLRITPSEVTRRFRLAALTRNEVNLHRVEHPNNALAVVRNITLDRSGDQPVASGGELVLVMPVGDQRGRTNTHRLRRPHRHLSPALSLTKPGELSGR
jgi:hypothetical protein